MNSSSYRLGLLHGALAVGLLLAVFVAVYAQDWIDIHGFAKHLDHEQHCNSMTTGLGIEHGLTETVRLMSGFYRNSNCKWSTYSGAAYLPMQIGAAHIGGLAGFVTGYKSSVLPAAGFVAAIEGRDAGGNIVLIPPVGRTSPGVIWFQFKVPW